MGHCMTESRLLRDPSLIEVLWTGILPNAWCRSGGLTGCSEVLSANFCCKRRHQAEEHLASQFKLVLEPVSCPPRRSRTRKQLVRDAVKAKFPSALYLYGFLLCAKLTLDS